MTEPWTCEWMRGCIEYSASELRQLGVIQSWDASAVWETALTPCRSCRSRQRSSTHRACRGWHFSAWGRHGVVFSPTPSDQGPSIRATLEGTFSTVRPESWSGDWRSSPSAECTAAVTLHDALTDRFLCRQHLDLANPKQPGSVWHLQLGGVHGGGDKEALRSIAMLRWPTSPIDFLLALEMCLFLFHGEAWEDIRRRDPWRSNVKSSEDLVLSHYADALRQYRSQDGFAHSWLSAQCNRSGSLSPRPG